MKKIIFIFVIIISILGISITVFYVKKEVLKDKELNQEIDRSFIRSLKEKYEVDTNFIDKVEVGDYLMFTEQGVIPVSDEKINLVLKGKKLYLSYENHYSLFGNLKEEIVTFKKINLKCGLNDIEIVVLTNKGNLFRTKINQNFLYQQQEKILNNENIDIYFEKLNYDNYKVWAFTDYKKASSSCDSEGLIVLTNERELRYYDTFVKYLK